MLGFFGFGPMELIVIGGLCCAGALLVGGVIFGVLFLRPKDSLEEDGESFAENADRGEDSKQAKS